MAYFAVYCTVCGIFGRRGAPLYHEQHKNGNLSITRISNFVTFFPHTEITLFLPFSSDPHVTKRECRRVKLVYFAKTAIQYSVQHREQYSIINIYAGLLLLYASQQKFPIRVGLDFKRLSP